MYKKNVNNIFNIVIIIILILILLYLLIQNIGYIENQKLKVPTGNIDIFEIDCPCCDDDISQLSDVKDDNAKITFNDKKVFKEKKDVDKNKLEIIDKNINDDNMDETDINLEKKDIEVFDNNKMWDNKTLRIFTNPAFEYKNVIAPNSSNSYEFMIRNNENFEITVDIIFEETNNSNINMMFKLKNNGSYILGEKNKYESIKNKKIENIKLRANEEKTYVLDWKWIDSENDANIGFDANSQYKLSIRIGVK